jgi:hypothetical protein
VPDPPVQDPLVELMLQSGSHSLQRLHTGDLYADWMICFTLFELIAFQELRPSPSA